MTRFHSFVTTLALAAGCVGNTTSHERSQSAGNDARTGCTLTQGYWKNHEAAWPVVSITLGTVAYSQAEALAVLRTPVRGNGLVALAHQLIAAKLNLAAGADGTALGSAIADADARIGGLVSPPVGMDSLAPRDTTALASALDDFNTGGTGPGHCDDGPPTPACGDGTLDAGEHCDDGNTTAGDGCSATCTTEPPAPVPVCGDGVLDAGEQCDDGNTTPGDGCSATCTTEPAPCACCGDGVIEGTEQCDDGNATAGDGCSATCTTEA